MCTVTSRRIICLFSLPVLFVAVIYVFFAASLLSQSSILFDFFFVFVRSFVCSSFSKSKYKVHAHRTTNHQLVSSDLPFFFLWVFWFFRPLFFSSTVCDSSWLGRFGKFCTFHWLCTAGHNAVGHVKITLASLVCLKCKAIYDARSQKIKRKKWKPK